MRFAKALNRPTVFLAVFVLFLAVDGLLLYGHYQPPLPRDTFVADTPPNPETDNASAEESVTPVGQVPTPAEETDSEESISNEADFKEAVTSEESISNETNFEEAVTILPEAPSELGVVVRVVDAPAYLTIQEDGIVVLEQEVQPGFSMQFGADREVGVSTGDAGATWVELNGYELGPIGASGEPATRTFTVGL